MFLLMFTCGNCLAKSATLSFRSYFGIPAKWCELGCNGKTGAFLKNMFCVGSASDVVQVTPISTAQTRSLKRSYAMLGMFCVKTISTPFGSDLIVVYVTDITENLVQRRPPPKRMVPKRTEGRRGVSGLIERLDSRIRPGVTAAEFKELSVQCATCEEIFTRRAFRYHQCSMTPDY